MSSTEWRTGRVWNDERLLDVALLFQFLEQRLDLGIGRRLRSLGLSLGAKLSLASCDLVLDVCIGPGRECLPHGGRVELFGGDAVDGADGLNEQEQSGADTQPDDHRQ